MLELNNLRWMRIVASNEAGYLRFNLHRTRQIIAKGIGLKNLSYTEKCQKKKKRSKKCRALNAPTIDQIIFSDLSNLHWKRPVASKKTGS